MILLLSETNKEKRHWDVHDKGISIERNKYRILGCVPSGESKNESFFEKTFIEFEGVESKSRILDLWTQAFLSQGIWN